MNGLGINRFENLHFSTRESVFARRKNLPTAKMSTTVFLCFIVLLMLPGIAESICCDDIKAQAESKYNAYKTLCSTGNNLPANCCSDIASEVKKFRDSYKALCQLSSKFVINTFCSYMSNRPYCVHFIQRKKPIYKQLHKTCTYYIQTSTRNLQDTSNTCRTFI